MEITQEEFDVRLEGLAKKNWKIKNLLRDCGGFDGLPGNLQDKIYRMIGVTKKITSTSYEVKE